MTTDGGVLSVSVRELCAFAARHGDLLPGHAAAPSAEEGKIVHRLIAQRRSEGYEAEVSVTGRFGDLHVRGRMDLLDAQHWRIEEIKSHHGPVESVPEAKRRLDWAQLQVYGAILCQLHPLTEVELALVYVRVGSLDESPDVRRMAASDLLARFESWCTLYLEWAQREQAHRQRRDAALVSLPFAFSRIRPEQRQLMEGVAQTIQTGGLLLAEGPTGVGKTLGVLFPALRRLPKDGFDKIVYATAKTTGRHEALKALQQLTGQDPGGPVRVLELAAQERTCLQPLDPEVRICHGAVCPYAQGFFDKLPAARRDAVERGWLDHDALRTVSRDHGICPYFLGQELLRWVDVVVSDYHHVFSDHAAITPLVAESGWRVIALVDEAHNLVDRAQAMFSAELAMADVAVARANAPRSLHSAFDAWEQEWQGLLASEARRHGSAAPRWTHIRRADRLPPSWMPALQRLGVQLGEHFAEDPRRAQGPLLRFWFKCLRFTALLDGCDELALLELDTRAGSWGEAMAALGVPETDAARLQPLLFAGLDDDPAAARPDAGVLRLVHHVPAPRIQPVWAHYAAWVIFSATLPDTAFFCDMLGVPTTARRLDVPSPFTPAQLEVRIAPVSTRYADRPVTIGPIVARLLAQMRSLRGNYLAFFSSFAYLSLAAEEIARQAPGCPVWRQAPGMTPQERQAFLDRFSAGGHGLGLAVLGGVFGEGVDLPGDRLIGAFIVSVAHPHVDDRLQAILGLRRERLGARKAHDYTLVQPGLQKVIQAAGRVIRTTEDRGTVVLFDERFLRPAYRSRLPGWWQTQPVKPEAAKTDR